MSINNDVETELGRRVFDIINYSGMKDGAFAKHIGVSPQFMSGIKTGKKSPGLNVVSGILNTFSDISAEWLLRGAGDMLLSNQSKTNLDTISPNQTKEINDLKHQIELLQVKLSYTQNLYEKTEREIYRAERELQKYESRIEFYEQSIQEYRANIKEMREKGDINPRKRDEGDMEELIKRTG